MKPKLKSILSIIALVLLSFAFLFTLLANLTLLIPETQFTDPDPRILRNLESEKWSLEKQLEYQDYMCEIKSKLPNENSQILYIVITKYENEIPITTDINPYPELTSISEIGIVESSSPIGIRAETKKIRLYRIELLSDPGIYIEYISHKDEPYLYIIKDSHSSEFLLYPIIKNEIVPIDTAYYIIDASISEN